MYGIFLSGAVRIGSCVSSEINVRRAASASGVHVRGVELLDCACLMVCEIGLALIAKL